MANDQHKDSHSLFQASIDDLDFLSLIEAITKHHENIDGFIGNLFYEKTHLDLASQALCRELGPEIRILKERAKFKKRFDY